MYVYNEINDLKSHLTSKGGVKQAYGSWNGSSASWFTSRPSKGSKGSNPCFLGSLQGVVHLVIRSSLTTPSCYKFYVMWCVLSACNVLGLHGRFI